MRPSGGFYKHAPPTKLHCGPHPLHHNHPASVQAASHPTKVGAEGIEPPRGGFTDPPSTLTILPKIHFPNQPRLSVKPNLVLPARFERATFAM